MTLEERIEKIKDLRPIDDVFFEAIAEDKEVCQEMLQTIMEDNSLTVSDVIVQRSERIYLGAQSDWTLCVRWVTVLYVI